MFADGGEAISRMALLRDQAGMFGPSPPRPPPCASWQAQWRAWLLSEESGRNVPAARAAGPHLPVLVIDLEPTTVEPRGKGAFGDCRYR